MRKLILHRQKALACFAMKYHCIVNQDKECFLRELAALDQPVHLIDETDFALRNGETIALPLSEDGCRFFVVACLNGWDLPTNEIVVEPGTDDVFYTVVTDFDGNRRLRIYVEPAKL